MTGVARTLPPIASGHGINGMTCIDPVIMSRVEISTERALDYLRRNQFFDGCMGASLVWKSGSEE